MTNTEDKLKAAIEILTAAKKVVSSANDIVRDNWIKLVKEKFCIEVGDVVTCRGKRFRITQIRIPQDYDLASLNYKPWVYGNPQNKDGRYGKGEKCLYGDWEIEGGNDHEKTNV